MNDILRIREICKAHNSCYECPLHMNDECLMCIPPANLDDEQLYQIEKILGYKEKKIDACIDCEYFSDKEYYADNATNVSAVVFGSCKKCQRNFVTSDPYNQVPSWCPLKGGKDAT